MSFAGKEYLWYDGEDLAPFHALVQRYDECFIVMDEHTHACCYDIFLKKTSLGKHQCIIIPAGEAYKTIQTVELIWTKLFEAHAGRDCLAILLGGGVLLDLAGYAVASYKRGIACVNVPTTTLSAVDASVGAKRGFNFADTKNIIGTFYPAEWVMLIPRFFDTLSPVDLLSGWAEMLKHALLEPTSRIKELLDYRPEMLSDEASLPLLKRTVETKIRLVTEDPYEKGVRQMLNFGHTFAHALEAFCLSKHKVLPHGLAVAAGIVMELYLSHQIYQYPESILNMVSAYIREMFPYVHYPCKAYGDIFTAMLHDKKNKDGEIRAALLKAPEHYAYGTVLKEVQVFMALDYYKEVYNA